VVGITWFGHSAVGFKTERSRYLCDPISDERLVCTIPEAEGPARAVFVSHSHWDHLSLETLEQVSDSETLLFAPFVVLQRLESSQKLSRLAAREVNPTDLIDLGDTAVEVVEASEGVSFLFTFKADEVTALFMGDSVVTDAMGGVDADLIFFPMWALKQPSYKDRLCNFLSQSLAIPIHFHHSPDAMSNFYLDPTQFEELTRHIARLHVLPRGEEQQLWFQGETLCIGPAGR